MTDEADTPSETSTWQGIAVDGSDKEKLRQAIEMAVDYRGDVTITRRSTGESIIGFAFDRKLGTSLRNSTIRIIPRGDGPRITLSVDDIAEVRFTGRDTAAGKSFEQWAKTYLRKKLAEKGREPAPGSNS